MSSTEGFFFVKNKILPAAEAGLDLNDLGLFRGYAVFDYFRTHQGKPLFMDEYLKRFRISASQLGLSVPYSDEEIETIIWKLIPLHAYPESGVRLLLTGGSAEDIFTPVEPTLIIRIERSLLPEEHYYTQGISLLSHEYLRPIPTAKTTNYIEAIRLWPKVKSTGALEILYYWEGHWLECSRSNFFVVCNGTLLTAPTTTVLPGITRQMVLHLARQNRISAEERNLPHNILTHCQEAFITATTKRVMPVVKIDDLVIGSGKPGKITQQLMEAMLLLEQKYSVENS